MIVQNTEKWDEIIEWRGKIRKRRAGKGEENDIKEKVKTVKVKTVKEKTVKEKTVKEKTVKDKRKNENRYWHL